MSNTTIAIASDHAGVALKERLVRLLKAEGYTINDLGPFSEESVDYPDFADKVTEAISSGQAEKGILLCGSGIGMSIAANRNPVIRAALCHNTETASLCRQHNNANVLVLGARFISPEDAIAATKIFLTTEFEGGRHQRRVEKLS